MLSIAIGVIALTTVLSVVNGFERALTGHLIGMETEATIIAYGDSLGDLASPPEGPKPAGWRRVAAQLRQHPEVVGAAPYLQSEALATRGEAVKGALLRGILPQEERQVSPLAEKMTAGRLEALAPGAFWRGPRRRPGEVAAGRRRGPDLLGVARRQCHPGRTSASTQAFHRRRDL